MEDYHSRFSVVKRDESLSTDHLIKGCKIIFVESALQTKYHLMLPQILFQKTSKNSAGSQKTTKTHRVVSMSHNHQINRYVEAFINFMEYTMKKCFHTNKVVYIALLQKNNTNWS